MSDPPFLIFLENFLSVKSKHITKKLSNIGITVYDIQEKNSHNQLFDDQIRRQINTLYVHLVDGKYYNDKAYTKKKFEMEREMILLLAGKLGVRELSYTCKTTETIMSGIRCGFFAKWFNANAKYNIETITRNGCSGKEIYLNRGALAYLFSKNITAVNDNIRRKLGNIHHIFSYKYYQDNPKLSAFVYKRFVYRMKEMDYTVDVEDISEKIFAVAICFMENGLQLKVNQKTSITENIHYHFEFFSDEELKTQLAKDNRITEEEVQDVMQQNNDSPLFLNGYSPRSENENDQVLNDSLN